MDEKIPRNLSFILLIILPVLAIASLTVAAYLWYQALKPEPIEIREQIWFRIPPESFSEELEPNLHDILSRDGIGTELVTAAHVDSTLPGINSIYRVRVPQKFSLRLLNTRITQMIADMGGEVFQGIENETGTTLTLKVGAGREPTDIIILMKSSRVTVRSGKMAIVIDDFGYQPPDIAERLCNLRQTVTLSILPFQPFTRQIVDRARSTGTSYILHMP
ncbi:divergent polysaccharide deacetylase family protein, partial [Candidatus Latescibacterota bacterium]